MILEKSLVEKSDKMVKPKDAVQKMSPYHPPTSGRGKKLRLDFNENTIGCSPKVIRALQKIDSNAMSVYPEYEDFKPVLAKHLNISPSELILSNGTDEGIKMIIDTFMEGGEEIIIPTPTFAMFKFYASVAEAKITEVLYNEDLSFPTDKVLAAINPNAKLVVLVNPNNPTGTSIAEEDIIAIIKKASENNAIVLSDEAYYGFYEKSSINLIKKYDNLFVTRTFSKAFGLAGIRLGYTLSQKDNIAALAKAGSPYNVSTLAIIAAKAALDDVEFVNKYTQEVRDNTDWFIEELSKLGLSVFPTDANFVVVKIGEKCGEVCDTLKEKGILVRNRTRDPLLEGCIRITIGTKEQCDQVLRELKTILGK